MFTHHSYNKYSCHHIIVIVLLERLRLHTKLFIRKVLFTGKTIEMNSACVLCATTNRLYCMVYFFSRNLCECARIYHVLCYILLQLLRIFFFNFQCSHPEYRIWF